MWHLTYSTEVMSVPDPCDWRIPTDIESRVVGTSANPKQAGLSHTKRIQAGSKRKDDRTCARCHKIGHYQSMYTELIQLHVEEASNSQVGAKRHRKSKKCEICGVVGHTQKRCNDHHRFE